MLPIGIEAYGAYALAVWLASAALQPDTRQFAKWSFIASLTTGGGAQIASHILAAASYTSAPWLVTMAVACIPVLVVGLATGLATLVRRDSRLLASAGGSAPALATYTASRRPSLPDGGDGWRSGDQFITSAGEVAS